MASVRFDYVRASRGNHLMVYGTSREMGQVRSCTEKDVCAGNTVAWDGDSSHCVWHFSTAGGGRRRGDVRQRDESSGGGKSGATVVREGAHSEKAGRGKRTARETGGRATLSKARWRGCHRHLRTHNPAVHFSQQCAPYTYASAPLCQVPPPAHAIRPSRDLSNLLRRPFPSGYSVTAYSFFTISRSTKFKS